MHRRIPTDEEIMEERKVSVYKEHCPPMNRKERRTAKGKLLIAKAELEVTKMELAHYKLLSGGII